MTKEPAESQSTYGLISDLVSELSYIHSFYLSAFRSEEKIAQMNQISGSLFGLIQRSIMHDIIRLICGLTDLPGEGDKANATIPRMIAELEPRDSKCSDKCRSILDGVEVPITTIRAHRHKRFMHIDRKTLQLGNQNLPKLLTDHIDLAVDGICRIMEEASRVFSKTYTDYHSIIDPTNASGALEWMIEDSARCHKLRVLALDPKNSDRTIRRLVSVRSDRNDESILSEGG